MGNGSEGSGAQVWPPHHTAGMFTFCAYENIAAGVVQIWFGVGAVQGTLWSCGQEPLRLQASGLSFLNGNWIGVGLPPKLAEWWDVLFHSNSHQLSELLNLTLLFGTCIPMHYLTYLKIAVSSLPFRRVPQLHASWGGTLTGCLWLTSLMHNTKQFARELSERTVVSGLGVHFPRLFKMIWVI